MVKPNATRLTANIRRYPWYLFFRDSYFWGPAFFLYFTARLSFKEALLLEAIYYTGVALLEVPSGYFSDKFGRRPTLLLSSACMTAAYILFFTGGGFLTFAAAQFTLAAGFAFASGTDTALHYESLKALGRENEFTLREARALRFSFLAGGLAALIGGGLAVYRLELIYAASAVTAFISFLLAFNMEEPFDTKRKTAPLPMGRQVICLLKKAWQLRLRFLTLYAVVMTVLIHLPFEFYQPYLDRLIGDTDIVENATPAVTGLHLAVTMLVGGFCTRFVSQLQDRFRVRSILLGCTLFQILLIGSMALTVHPLVVILLITRTGSRAIATPLVNGVLNPLLTESERSTYLSIQSLLGRLSFGITLLILPLGASLFPSPFSGALISSLIIGMLLWTALWLTPFPRVRRRQSGR